MTTSQPGHRVSFSNVLTVLVKPVQYSLRGVRNDDGVRDRTSMTVLAKAVPPSDLSPPTVVFHGPNTDPAYTPHGPASSSMELNANL